VTPNAGLEIKADYLDITERDSQLLAPAPEASVLDRQGETIVVLDKKVDNLAVLAQVLGVNKVDLGVAVTPIQESQDLRVRLERPRVNILGTRVQADRRSRYAIAIEIKASGRHLPRPSREEDGRAFVAIQRGEAFGVRLINDADHDAAVELTLDGLSMFAFSDNKNYHHIIVPRHSNVLIKGWHRNNRVSDKFLITDYAKSAVAELLANPDQIGTITTTFAAAWNPEEGPPADETAQVRDLFNPGPAVGRGSPVLTPFKEVKREFGRIREVVSVRYRKPGQ
jgi:hypothetical protein